MSSRVIVKNLPKKMTEDKFKQHFSKIGEITEAKLKYTKDGHFRQFGFIGFKTEESAKKAIEYFNQTYINATKVTVEECQSLKDTSKPRPWSKYAPGSSSYKKLHEDEDAKAKESAAELKKKEASSKKLKKIEELLGPLKDDDKFKEFVAMNKAISSKDSIWKNDIDFLLNTKKAEETEDEPKPVKEAETKNDTKQDKKSDQTDKSATETVATEGDEKKQNKKKDKAKVSNEDDESDFENGRLFIRNLPYTCKEEDLEALFSKFKPLVEVNMPIDSFSKKPKGFAYITFMFPEHALKAFNELDGSIFQGRMLHIIPAKSRDETKTDDLNLNLKQKRDIDKKKQAQKGHNWNTLFVNQDTLANLMASKYNVDKSELFDVQNSKKSVAVRLAVGETQIVNDMRKFLIRNGVKLDAFGNADGPRSKTTILIKNLPINTCEAEIKELFDKYGLIKRVVMPEYGIAALIDFQERQEARVAFTKLAYRKFKNVPLYLEWAPMDIFEGDKSEVVESDDEGVTGKAEEAEVDETSKPVDKQVEDDDADDGTVPEPNSTLFIKNLNFSTNESGIVELFRKIGKCKATVARKISPRQELLSMGYGFVEFKTHAHALEAIKKYQNHELDGHQLELKLSTKQINPTSTAGDNETRNNNNKRKNIENSTKICVRNVPFEAKTKEIEELFKVFGELKYVRLPKKIDGTHRGFGFVEFLTKNDAKRAFDALCHSTHLFGRRLVLEWSEMDQTQDVDVLRVKEAQLSGPSSKRLKKSKILDDLRGDDQRKSNGNDNEGDDDDDRMDFDET